MHFIYAGAFLLGAYVGAGTFWNAAGITLIEAVGDGSVGAASSSLEYVVVGVNIVLALEAVLAFIRVVFWATVRIGFIALAFLVAKGSTIDLEALPATNVAAVGAFCILVAGVRRKSARRRVTRLQ